MVEKVGWKVDFPRIQMNLSVFCWKASIFIEKLMVSSWFLHLIHVIYLGFFLCVRGCLRAHGFGGFKKKTPINGGASMMTAVRHHWFVHKETFERAVWHITSLKSNIDTQKKPRLKGDRVSKPSSVVSMFLWWSLCLGGGFKYIFYFHPDPLGKIPILTCIFFKGVETTN